MWCIYATRKSLLGSAIFPRIPLWDSNAVVPWSGVIFATFGLLWSSYCRDDRKRGWKSKGTSPPTSSEAKPGTAVVLTWAEYMYSTERNYQYRVGETNRHPAIAVPL